MRRQIALVTLAGLLLAACATTSLDERRAASAHLATDAGWQRLNINAGAFILAAFVPPGHPTADTLTVYIEGDGLAWLDSSTPSFDPTPLDPLALRLALQDSAGASAYLARPCQYVSGTESRGCAQKYWTTHRFAPEVVSATRHALDQLKARVGAHRLVLVGYSGGGAVAALVAAERPDVTRLITIAGNLDIAAWTSLHALAPLSGSLNPADAWARLRQIPQKHYVGGKDENMPASVARAYAARFPIGERPQIIVEPSFDHHCCWETRWPALK